MASGAKTITDIYNRYGELTNMDSNLLDSCNKNGVCVESKGAVLIDGINAEIGFEQFKSELNLLGRSFAQVLEKRVLIRVDELMRTKKKLVISLNNGVYKIGTKEVKSE